MTPEEAAREYERLLRLIHAMSDEELDGPAGEAACDEMDLPWRKMSEEGCERMRRLSAQLNRERDGQ